MTQNERVKQIRKSLGLTLEKFGEGLGIGKTAVSKIEHGHCSLTDANIKAICREFNVREEWLRSGSGEMFLDLTEDEFARAAATLSNDAFVRSLIVEYWKLDADGRQLFRDFIHKLSDGMRGLE